MYHFKDFSDDKFLMAKGKHSLMLLIRLTQHIQSGSSSTEEHVSSIHEAPQTNPHVSIQHQLSHCWW